VPASGRVLASGFNSRVLRRYAAAAARLLSAKARPPQVLAGESCSNRIQNGCVIRFDWPKRKIRLRRSWSP
jgi:hypothetical protein